MEDVGWRGRRKEEEEQDTGMGSYLVRVLFETINELHQSTTSNHFQPSQIAESALM